MKASCKKLTKTEVDQVAKLTADCFKADPFVKAAYKNIENFYKLARVTTKYCSEFGEVHIAYDEGKIVGAALWIPPDVPAMNAINVFKHGTLGYILKFAFTTNPFVTFGLFGMSSSFSDMHFKDKPHYYLITIASAKKGAGSSLMDYAIKRFGEESTYYLENSNEINNDFYTKFGFSKVYSYSIKDSKMSCMVRERRENID